MLGRPPAAHPSSRQGCRSFPPKPDGNPEKSIHGWMLSSPSWDRRARPFRHRQPGDAQDRQRVPGAVWMAAGRQGGPPGPGARGAPRPVPAGESVAPLYPLNPHWPRSPKPSGQGRCPHILSPSLALSPGLAMSHSENREGGWGHRQGSTPRPLTPCCVTGTRAQPPPSASHSLGLADRSLPARTPSCLSPVSSLRWLQGGPGRVCHAP